MELRRSRMPQRGRHRLQPGADRGMIERMHALMMRPPQWSTARSSAMTWGDPFHPRRVRDPGPDDHVVEDSYDEEENANGNVKHKTHGHPDVAGAGLDILALAPVPRASMWSSEPHRPDAKMLEGGARDNLRRRISLSRLSGQGAKMSVGQLLDRHRRPLVSGRAIASPDSSNPIEVQTFWVDDPWEAKAGGEIEPLLRTRSRGLASGEVRRIRLADLP
ncbi:hypothetical protein QJS66_23565 (plasmid) [Kocuria rhizophila]|nr:hypothetical protein QJS66_23565 [Kocuria rhizophila]